MQCERAAVDRSWCTRLLSQQRSCCPRAGLLTAAPACCALCPSSSSRRCSQRRGRAAHFVQTVPAAAAHLVLHAAEIAVERAHRIRHLARRILLRVLIARRRVRIELRKARLAVRPDLLVLAGVPVAAGLRRRWLSVYRQKKLSSTLLVRTRESGHGTTCRWARTCSCRAMRRHIAECRQVTRASKKDKGAPLPHPHKTSSTVHQVTSVLHCSCRATRVHRSMSVRCHATRRREEASKTRGAPW